MAVEYPQSWTDICNQALARLGVSLLSNVQTDTSNQAMYCRLFLGDAIEAVLGKHDWRAASKRAQLGLLSETPVYGYDHAYALPADCIRPYRVETGAGVFRAFSIESGKLITDAEEVWLTYVARPTDPTTLPTYLRRAIQGQLAAMLAPPMTSSDQLAIRIIAQADQDLKDAIAAEADNRPQESLADQLGSTWSDELR